MLWSLFSSARNPDIIGFQHWATSMELVIAEVTELHRSWRLLLTMKDPLPISDNWSIGMNHVSEDETGSPSTLLVVQVLYLSCWSCFSYGLTTIPTPILMYMGQSGKDDTTARNV